MTRLLIVGNSGFTHVGESFRRAAEKLALDVQFCDMAAAYAGWRPWRSVNWHLRGRRPSRLAAFSAHVLRVAQEYRPEVVLTTGIAPLERDGLEQLRKRGALLLNFSTDDPWNPGQFAPWFLRAIPAYDRIFSPRSANFEDFQRAGCRSIEYLPFAYDPAHCFPEALDTEERTRLGCDILFVGGADSDRVPIASSLARSGFDLSLYGQYWDKTPALRRFARGNVTADIVRKATAAAKVALCLVRRRNRDGHVMRSFEIAAIGACMLVENTPDHREIFGDEGASVLYFDNDAELTTKAELLLDTPRERERLAVSVRDRITSAPNTYQDRLLAMLRSIGWG